MIDFTSRPTVSDEAIQIALESAHLSAAAQNNVRRTKTAHRVKWLKNAAWMILAAVFCGAGIAYGALIGAGIFAVMALLATAITLLLALYYLWKALRPGAVTRSKVPDDPVAVMEQFLKPLLGDEDDGEHEWEQAYILLAPSVLGSVTPDRFVTAWTELREHLKSLICYESATCSRCGATDSKGLWSVRSYDVITDDIRPEGGYMRCEKCTAIYCKQCYSSMTCEEKRTCPSCGAEGFVTSRVFHSRPKLSLPSSRMFFQGFAESDANDERVAQLSAVVKIEPQIQDPYESRPGKEEWTVLGERGAIVVHCHNTGVRISERWHLVSALPKEGQPGVRWLE